MKVGVLTSSRADYGIYLPLLKKLESDKFFNLEVIAFGTHLSKYHGYTLVDIEKNNFSTVHKISSLVSNDDEEATSTSYGLTLLKFVDFWHLNKYDLVFCLGDRFEMSAAVQAGIPFQVKFAHIHGGETTLGAIDNIYRHQISLAAHLHFTSTKIFSKRVIELIGSVTNVYNVGALSLDGIHEFKPMGKDIFHEKFKIPEQDFALVTFHPETVASTENVSFAMEMRKGLSEISNNLFLVITMPNADTMGTIFRAEIEKLREAFPTRVLCIENFGKENYFNAMQYSKLLIGNTSSGILEAASFGKYVVNVGERQKGRLQNKNILNSKFNSKDIVEKVLGALKKERYCQNNLYEKAGTAEQILSVIKNHYVKARKF